MHKSINKRRKGFTLIELIVVMAILAILVLLAVPKLLNYTKEAQATQIKNDVKVVEGKLEEYLIRNNSNMPEGLEVIEKSEVESKVTQDMVHDVRGLVSSVEGDEFYKLKDTQRSKLKGNFIANEDGKVYYIHDKAVGGSGGGNNNDLDLVYTDETQFEFIASSAAPNQYIDPADSTLKGGYFKYVGTDDIVVVPHTLYDNELKDYYLMFMGSTVSKVVSDNPNVTDVGGMFSYSEATSLDLSSFDTSKVTYMGSMFSDSQATSLDLSSFDTSNVTDMSSMFYDSQATSLDLKNFNTSNVTDMSAMFNGSQATSLDLSSFNTSNVTNMPHMFSYSYATSLDLSSFNTSNVTNMTDMFTGSQATSLDLSSFDTSNVTNMDWMFYDSQATTGYAKTQDDADRFNTEDTGRPLELTFTIK